MKICEDRKHADIVFDGQYCPLCEAVEEIEELKEEIEKLERTT